MAKKKSPHFTGKPFPVQICDQLRHHVAERQAKEAKRLSAFEDRDAALAELENDSNDVEAKTMHSDAVRRIAQLDAAVKWHGNQIKQLIEDPDQESFEFMMDMSEDEDRVTGKPAAKPAEDKTKAMFPVQTPDPRPAKGKKSNEPAVAEGVHQHMLASVNELDLRDDLKAKLIKGELSTVGAVQMFIEGKGDLCERANVTPAASAAITSAVGTWIKKHTRAELEQSREGARA